MYPLLKFNMIFYRTKNIFLSVLLGLLAPAFVLAVAVVTVVQSVTLILPSDGSQYTLVGGGIKFDSLTVSSGTFSFSLPGGTNVEIISADKKVLTNSLGESTICDTSQSRVKIFNLDGQPTKTVTITPSGSCSTSGGGGGIFSSGGGGGGGGSWSPAPAPSALPVTPAPLVAKPAPQALLASPVFNRSLSVGSRGEDVERLQQLLAQDKEVYPDGLVTGFFGRMTEAAVKRFQAKYGLSAVGIVGPLTRSKLARVFGGALSAPPTPTPAAPAVGSAEELREKIQALQAQLLKLQLQLLQEKLKAAQGQ